MLTIGVDALLALWMLASPLAMPGPRCSKVVAGIAVIRAYPSAAPVTTPSKRPRTQRMPSTRSSAATKCISDVPGLAKHTSTPPPTSVRTRLSAPFILSLRSASSASCKFLACLSGCSTLPIESANWEISAAPALLLDRQRERAKLLMVDFDLDVVGGADGFELRSEVCGDEDESLVFFQAGVM